MFYNLLFFLSVEQQFSLYLVIFEQFIQQMDTMQ